MRAIFRCHHPSNKSNVVWLIDDSPSDNFPEVMSDVESGTLFHTLIIPATSRYNGSKIVCLAFFTDGSPTDISPPVMFTIKGG